MTDFSSLPFKLLPAKFEWLGIWKLLNHIRFLVRVWEAAASTLCKKKTNSIDEQQKCKCHEKRDWLLISRFFFQFSHWNINLTYWSAFLLNWVSFIEVSFINSWKWKSCKTRIFFTSKFESWNFFWKKKEFFAVFLSPLTLFQLYSGYIFWFSTLFC